MTAFGTMGGPGSLCFPGYSVVQVTNQSYCDLELLILRFFARHISLLFNLDIIVSFSTQNHYVPQFLQRKFLHGINKSKLLYLDLNPDKIIHSEGGYHYRNSLRLLGTRKMFRQDNLYTYIQKKMPTDIVEKRFFGAIDQFGAKAVDAFDNFTNKNRSHYNFNAFIRFIDTQKIRTPKGLDWISSSLSTKNHNDALKYMRLLYMHHITIWIEGVWEIVKSNNPNIGFIITDHPVTTYNKALFPGHKLCKYPYDPPIEHVGTHTIFPISYNSCLIITNLEYIRNYWINKTKIRENPRYKQPTMINLLSIQNGRVLDDKDVISINYILKNRAKRFIAAPYEDLLYPEEHINTKKWDKLGSKYFLMPDPRKVSFTTQIISGTIEGGVDFYQDEYGRQVPDGIADIEQKRNKEFESHMKFKKLWDQYYGPLSREELRSVY